MSLKRNVQVGSKICLVSCRASYKEQSITKDRADHMNALGPTGFSSLWC